MRIPAQIQQVKEKATCLFTKEAIEANLDKIAAEISEKLGESNPVVLCVLIGGLIPAGNHRPKTYSRISEFQPSVHLRYLTRLLEFESSRD